MPTIGILFYYFSNATNVPLNRALLFLFFTFYDFISFFLSPLSRDDKQIIDIQCMGSGSFWNILIVDLSK